MPQIAKVSPTAHLHRLWHSRPLLTREEGPQGPQDPAVLSQTIPLSPLLVWLEIDCYLCPLDLCMVTYLWNKFTTIFGSHGSDGGTSHMWGEGTLNKHAKVSICKFPTVEHSKCNLFFLNSSPWAWIWRDISWYIPSSLWNVSSCRAGRQGQLSVNPQIQIALKTKTI